MPLKLNHIYQGDALSWLKTFPDESVHCVITSPPYFGLRAYDVEPMIFGGKEGCEHEWVEKSRYWDNRTASLIAKEGKADFGGKKDARGQIADVICSRCGAYFGHLGLEPRPDLFISHLTEIFHEVKRVLRSDGTCWVVMGDSYAGGGGTSGHTAETKNFGRKTSEYGAVATGGRTWESIKAKDLIGTPWMLAFALRADGWWLRSDIIWHKPAPMPESVRDRPTKSHEYVFLLSKSKKYYYDQDAVREEYDKPLNRYGGDKKKTSENLQKGSYYAAAHRDRNMRPNSAGRNRRSVWTINTVPTKDLHFATFPPALVSLCIKAGTSEAGCCPKCSAPMARVVKKVTSFEGGSGKAGRSAKEVNASGKWAGKQHGENIKLGPTLKTETTGWSPTCTCSKNSSDVNKCGGSIDGTNATNPEPSRLVDSKESAVLSATRPRTPAIVLDPFLGSGTIALVARKLGRNFVGIELSPEYIKIAEKRLAQLYLF